VPIYAPLDYGSRNCGASNGVGILKELFEGLDYKTSRCVEIQREHSSYASNKLYGLVRKTKLEGNIPFIFGGDHLITCYTAAAVASVEGQGLNVLHFDAHHDAYPVPPATHYSFMNVLNSRINVVGRGYRWESEGQTAQHSPLPANGPIYLSIDVDYFSPEVISSVGHAVPTGIAYSPNIDELRSALANLWERVVAVDLCEWHGDSLPGNTGDRKSLTDLVRLIMEGLCS